MSKIKERSDSPLSIPGAYSNLFRYIKTMLIVYAPKVLTPNTRTVLKRQYKTIQRCRLFEYSYSALCVKGTSNGIVERYNKNKIDTFILSFICFVLYSLLFFSFLSNFSVQFIIFITII